MTHTPKQLKELAEFAAEYLDWVLDDSEWYLLPKGYDFEVFSPNYHIAELPQVFFAGDVFPPILMHLAQEKLEKKGFDCEYNQQVGIHLWEFNMSLDYDRPVARAENKNKFIAFWEAVQEAKGGK
jgi:hypothetical protein